MQMVTMHKAKSQLSALVAAAEAGEEIVIMRDTVPAVRLVPITPNPPARRFGALKGKLFVSAAFFDALPDEELDPWHK